MGKVLLVESDFGHVDLDLDSSGSLASNRLACHSSFQILKYRNFKLRLTPQWWGEGEQSNWLVCDQSCDIYDPDRNVAEKKGSHIRRNTTGHAKHKIWDDGPVCGGSMRMKLVSDPIPLPPRRSGTGTATWLGLGWWADIADRWRASSNFGSTARG